MKNNSKAKKSQNDPFDPKPVIQYAYEEAASTGTSRYVTATKGYFACEILQPKPCFSHWKVEVDGDLFAHLGGVEVSEYNYEKV